MDGQAAVSALVMSVGATPEPLEEVLAERLRGPAVRAVVFVCSSDNGCAQGTRPVAEQLKQRLTTLVPDGAAQPTVVIREVASPDLPSQVWAALQGVEEQLKQAAAAAGEDYDPGRVVADYTGGTKTMSMCLGLYAFVAGWRHELVAGRRGKNGSVLDGRVRVWAGAELIDRKARDDAALLAGEADYDGACRLLEGAVRRLEALGTGDAGELADGLAREAARLAVLAARQRHDFKGAAERLASLGPDGEAEEYERTAGEADFVRPYLEGDGKAASAGETRVWRLADERRGWLVVESILAVAEDLAGAGRYLEAVARLYRATELAAQLRLARCYGVCSGDVREDQLAPLALSEEALAQVGLTGGRRERVGTAGDRLQLGLRRAWELLWVLHDPVAQCFFAEPGSGEAAADRGRETRGKWLKDALEVRNRSVFAHGLGSPTADDWARVGEDWLQRLRELKGVFLARCKAGGRGEQPDCPGTPACRAERGADTV